jgi:hypoxanthine phosphoribosyltransferase
VENEPKFEVPTWSKFYTMLTNQADTICHSGFKPESIVSLTRRGGVPARIWSDLLLIYALTTVRVEFHLGIAETIRKILAKHGDATNVDSAKLVKVGLPKQLIEELPKETCEAIEC